MLGPCMAGKPPRSPSPPVAYSPARGKSKAERGESLVGRTVWKTERSVCTHFSNQVAASWLRSSATGCRLGRMRPHIGGRQYPEGVSCLARFSTIAGSVDSRRVRATDPSRRPVEARPGWPLFRDGPCRPHDVGPAASRMYPSPDIGGQVHVHFLRHWRSQADRRLGHLTAGSAARVLFR